MILMGRVRVPDVPLKVYSFLNFRFHVVKHSLATISRHWNWNLRGTKVGTKGRRD